MNTEFIANLSASFQFSVSKILIEKVKKTLKKLSDKSVNVKSLSIVGGVSKNKYISEKIELITKKITIKLSAKYMEIMEEYLLNILFLKHLEITN